MIDNEILRARGKLIEDHFTAAVVWSNKFGSLGRNDKCACESGKKFKKCCIRTAPSLDNVPIGNTLAEFAKGYNKS